jgi:hypothetical protein
MYELKYRSELNILVLSTQKGTKLMTFADGYNQDVSSTNNSHIIDVLIGHLSLHYYGSNFGS